MLCHVEVQNTPCTDFYDQEHIHHSECRCHDDEKIGCNGGVGGEFLNKLRIGHIPVLLRCGHARSHYSTRPSHHHSFPAHRPRQACVLSLLSPFSLNINS